MYIDGVFSGGGIKGFALLGAVEVLEKKGYKFKRLAGTSAGAIVAAFLAAGYNSGEITEILEKKDMKELLDPRKTLLPFPLAKWLLVYFRMGFYRGRELEEWIAKSLAQKGVYTFADLPKESLRIIASDLSTGRLLVLPDDLDGLGIPKETFPISRAVRMSCSLPFFFEPIRLNSLSGRDIIVDGGLLSNFPIWLFQGEDGRKTRPVIGVKLSSKLSEQPKRKIANGLELFEALFSTMKDAHDARYISRKMEKDIIFISIDDTYTSEFSLTDEKKNALVEKGRSSAEQFLKSWTY